MGCNTSGTASFEEGGSGEQINSQMMPKSLAVKSR